MFFIIGLDNNKNHGIKEIVPKYSVIFIKQFVMEYVSLTNNTGLGTGETVYENIPTHGRHNDHADQTGTGVKSNSTNLRKVG